VAAAVPGQVEAGRAPAPKPFGVLMVVLMAVIRLVVVRVIVIVGVIVVVSVVVRLIRRMVVGRGVLFSGHEWGSSAHKLV
jgi:hypothetical protein